jgi:phosphohistidine phosphatase
MNIYLIRHGEAEPPSETKPHELRELTREGVETVQASAVFWRNFTQSFDIILSSPLKRAAQTANLIRDVLNVKQVVVEEISLLNGGLTEDLLSIAEALGMNDIAMVGHQPDIGMHIASMTGSIESNFNISPVSIAKIRFVENPRIGKGILELLLPPINKKG